MTPSHLAEPWGVLVLRVWVREGDPATLRAHVSQSLEVAAADYSIGVAQGMEAILDAVRVWLSAFQEHAPSAMRHGDAAVTAARQQGDGRPALSPRSRKGRAK